LQVVGYIGRQVRTEPKLNAVTHLPL